MPSDSVEFGWGAPPMIEQHPILGEEAAAHFDADNKAIVRLSVRGIITQTQKHAAFKRLSKSIEAEIRKAIKKSAA